MISLDLATIVLHNNSNYIVDAAPADTPIICSDHECGMDPPSAMIALVNTVVSGVTELWLPLSVLALVTCVVGVEAVYRRIASVVSMHRRYAATVYI